MADGPTDAGVDHEFPLNDTEFPPADTATQNVGVAQETDVSVPPTPVACAVDHVPCRRTRAEPRSSTDMQNVLDGQETPYSDVLPEPGLGSST